MYPPLRAAKAKVDPGREDLKTLRENIGTLLERNPYRVEVEFDRKTGWHVAYARIVQEPEPDLAVLVGSAAYQFHSALNLIAWELAARKIGRKKVETKDVKRDIAFPISERRQDFHSLRIIRKASVSKPAIAALEGVQPYMSPHMRRGPRPTRCFLSRNSRTPTSMRARRRIWPDQDAGRSLEVEPGRSPEPNGRAAAGG
jgi:hypothetical protein